MSDAARRAIPRWLLVLCATCLAPERVEAQAKKKPEKAEKKAGEKTARDVELEKQLLRSTQKVEGSHLKELDQLVTWASTNGLKAEASSVVGTMTKISPDYPGLAKAKEKAEKTAPPKDESKVAGLKTTFAKKLEEANDKNANRLFGLATSCMKVGLFTRSYDLVNDVVEADPDHKKARDILGYAWDSTTKTWITKWEAEMRKKAFLTEEGWVKKEDKAKWDKGLREYSGKWIANEEEERIRRRNNYYPFSIESEHYRVETNLGRKEALEFATLLEDFYGQFFRFYLGFYDQAAGAKLFFAPAKNKKKHLVKVYPTRDDYLIFVKQDKGNNELARNSAGFWDPGDFCAYFYYSDRESTLHTLYHEGTHQLFGETKTQGSGSKGNNWVVEGIATYMESWEKVDGKWLPGHKLGVDFLRTAQGYLASAADKDKWTLGSFLAIDNTAFHKENRGLNYALSGALCHFLIHGQDEIYREPFIHFISDYYAGKVVEDSLGRALSVEGVVGTRDTIQALEKQFKDYMGKLGESGSTAKTQNDEGASTGQ